MVACVLDDGADLGSDAHRASVTRTEIRTGREPASTLGSMRTYYAAKQSWGGAVKVDELYIGGEWVAGAGGEKLEVRSPATLDLVGEVPLATADDMDRAVAAARAAFDDGPWPGLTMGERADRLTPLVAALQSMAVDLDELVPLESGIPVVFASGSSSIPLVEYYLDLARADAGDEVRPGRPGATGDGIVRRVPVGVVAGITPWNGPVMQVLMKLVPALLAGCPVVIKPAPETPLSACKVAEALAAADLPRVWSASCRAGATSASTWSATRVSTTCRSRAAPVPASRSPRPADGRCAASTSSSAASPPPSCSTTSTSTRRCPRSPSSATSSTARPAPR